MLGTYEWMVYNDSRECSIEESYTAVLTLSGCGGDQFRRYSDNYNIDIEYEHYIQTANTSMLLKTLILILTSFQLQGWKLHQHGAQVSMDQPL